MPISLGDVTVTGGGLEGTVIEGALVPRLIDPTEGAVLLDGVDLRELDPAEIRRLVGFVPQETFLFSATIAERKAQVPLGNRPVALASLR